MLKRAPRTPSRLSAIKFRVRHIVFDDCNSTYARAVFQGRECVYEETMIGVVGHGVYNHAAREPDLAKNILHVAEGRVRRFVERVLLCRVLGGVCIDMKLTIATEWGRRRIGPSCLSFHSRNLACVAASMRPSFLGFLALPHGCLDICPCRAKVRAPHFIQAW